MKLQKQTYYNVYEVVRNKEGNIVDLKIDFDVIETIRKKSSSFINNLNDSENINDLDDIRTYFYDGKDGRKEKASFIDYELIKKPYFVIMDNIEGVLYETDNVETFNEKVGDLLYDYENGDKWANGNGKAYRFNYYNNNTFVVIREY